MLPDVGGVLVGAANETVGVSATAAAANKVKEHFMEDPFFSRRHPRF
jgi:hypothetical protein